MRVTMTQLRKGGRLLTKSEQKIMRGELLTKKFIGGTSLVKVLEFIEVMTAPGTYELSDPKVKDCPRGESTIVYTGLALEDDAWVAQEWLVDVAPVGSGWLKPERRYG